MFFRVRVYFAGNMVFRQLLLEFFLIISVQTQQRYSRLEIFQLYLELF
jgi:hypothetical protein